MIAHTKSITESFFEYFEICYAKEEYQKASVGKIRYRVYCEEFAYEAADAFPDCIERDEFDQRSVHCLVTHKPTGTPAGCVRLVLTEDGGQLPFEKFCRNSLDSAFFENQIMERKRICEISRLAVDRMFRRRTGEAVTRFGGIHHFGISSEERRTFPFIAMSCYLAATSLGSLAGCTAAVAMMEPFLPRLLGRSGLNVRKVGKDINYHGLRAPYFITLDETLDKMFPELRELYDEIHRILAQDYMRS